MTPLASIDWLVIAAYCLAALAIGVLLSRRATKNMDEYFVAGRTLPWWIAGTSMVATSFAADTPLAISRIVRTQGLQGNWFWWSGVMAFMLCAVLFARYWRRARLITDAELYELRYDGPGARGLRSFNAAYRSIFLNCITMGWVTLAMTKIIGVLLDLPSIAFLSSGTIRILPPNSSPAAAGIDPSSVAFLADEKIIGVVICILIALTYATISGMWGVVATDLVQFVIAMFGSISLAVVAVSRAGGLSAMRAGIIQSITTHAPQLAAQGASKLCPADTILHFFPRFDGLSLALATFIIYVTVQWWGGSEGGGFLAQRLFACKNERHGAMAVLWFSFAHFVIRVWPWIIVGLASIIFFPVLPDAELAYPKMIGFLPVGLRGLMVASLLAAFMSTIDTHLNWGASYIVNDLYKRFLAPGRPPRHYVRVGQIASILLMILAGVTAVKMKSVYGAWLYLSEIGSGLILAILLRWFWWRINAWSEIAAMGASFVLANSFHILGKRFGAPFFYSDDWYPVRMLLILAICTLIWVTVTLLTRPVSRAQLRRFYTRVRPAGLWGPVREPGDPVPPPHHARRILTAWSAGVVSVYCLLVGTGKILLAEPLLGFILISVGTASGAVLIQQMMIETRPAEEHAG